MEKQNKRYQVGEKVDFKTDQKDEWFENYAVLRENHPYYEIEGRHGIYQTRACRLRHADPSMCRYREVA